VEYKEEQEEMLSSHLPSHLALHHTKLTLRLGRDVFVRRLRLQFWRVKKALIQSPQNEASNCAMSEQQCLYLVIFVFVGPDMHVGEILSRQWESELRLEAGPVLVVGAYKLTRSSEGILFCCLCN
jgi:hypothetical protein